MNAQMPELVTALREIAETALAALAKAEGRTQPPYSVDPTADPLDPTEGMERP